MKKAKNLMILWTITMFLVTFTCSLSYLISQQVLRLGANELPMQLATTTALNLQSRQNVQNTPPNSRVDISKSLDPFVLIYDNNKKLRATSGLLDNVEPSYPTGVFDTVDKNGEARVTWQPRSGLRFATVAIKTNSGYIVAARSLSETERLISSIGRLVLLAWLTCVFFSALALATLHLLMRRIKIS